jgi:hypothetical protein
VAVTVLTQILYEGRPGSGSASAWLPLTGHVGLTVVVICGAALAYEAIVHRRVEARARVRRVDLMARYRDFDADLRRGIERSLAEDFGASDHRDTNG